MNKEIINDLLFIAQFIESNNQMNMYDSYLFYQEELAFYDALTRPEAVKDFYTNKELVEMTKELTETLRKNKTIDKIKNATKEELLEVIDQLNHDNSVDGFIVQMPLPKQIAEEIERLKNTIFAKQSSHRTA